jgi:hypothetical protein
MEGFEMKRTVGLLVVGLLLLTGAGPLGAVPITYNAQLFNGVPETGTINQPNGEENNPVGAQYYSFFATAGSNVTITGTRLDNGFDMSFWVFSGLYNDTTDFGATFPGAQAANFIDFADDEIPHPGPFGDPLSNFLAPVTGFYTVAVTNFLSDGTGPPFDFQLQANGVSEVPEPTSLAIFGLATVAGGLYLRRRKRAVA